VAYDIRIRGVEVSVPLAKIGKAGPDGGCERSVSAMPGHLLPTCLQPFEIHHKPCILFSFIRGFLMLRARMRADPKICTALCVRLVMRVSEPMGVEWARP
jgi:hypothetical protein